MGKQILYVSGCTQYLCGNCSNVFGPNRWFQLFQMFSSIRLSPDLEKLNADLPRWSIQLIQGLSRSNDYTFNIIARRAVRNNDGV